MKNVWLSWIVVLSTVSAVGQSPIVRAHLEPARDVLVGEPVRMSVTVYVPNYFTGSPDFPEFEMEGAVIVLPQDRPENSNTEIGGVRYAGITETYVIYPQRAGDFHLPPVQLTVPFASAPPKSTVAKVSLPAITFRADVPAAAKGMDYFLPTTSLTIRQVWSSTLTKLRVGDSVERTITVTATKVQAMLIPPLPFDIPDGIRIYPEEPHVQDQKTDRGDFVFGRRVQSAKYLLQKEGQYTLPPLEVKWWNLSKNRMETASLPEVHLTVAPNPDYVAELPPTPEPIATTQIKHVSFWRRYGSRVVRISSCVLVIAVLFWILRLYMPRLYRRLQRWREDRRHTEFAYFRTLQSACNHNDAVQTYAGLLRWLAVVCPGDSVPDVLRRSDDSALTTEVNRLGEVLYSSNPSGAAWTGRQLLTLLKRQRSLLRTTAPRRAVLEGLNPQAQRSSRTFVWDS